MLSRSAYCIYDVRRHFRWSQMVTRNPTFFNLFCFTILKKKCFLKVIGDALTFKTMWFVLSLIKTFTIFWGSDFFNESIRGVKVKVVDLHPTWVKFPSAKCFFFLNCILIYTFIFEMINFLFLILTNITIAHFPV